MSNLRAESHVAADNDRARRIEGNRSGTGRAADDLIG